MDLLPLNGASQQKLNQGSKADEPKYFHIISLQQESYKFFKPL